MRRWPMGRYSVAKHSPPVSLHPDETLTPALYHTPSHIIVNARDAWVSCPIPVMIPAFAAWENHTYIKHATSKRSRYTNAFRYRIKRTSEDNTRISCRYSKISPIYYSIRPERTNL